MRYDVGRFRRPMRRGAMEQMVSLISLGDGSTLSLDFTAMSSLDSRFTYTRNSIATFINSSGLVQQVTAAATNDPTKARFDYDPTTLAPRGLLIEGSATNELTNSETFGTGWTDTNITRNSTNNTSPANDLTALRVTASAANATIIRSAAMGTSAQRTLSVWLRRVSGTGNIQFTTNNGTAWTTQAITSSWVRYTFTATTEAQQVGFRIVTSGDSIELWGAQLEAGSGASSYIPTGASTVQRAADSCAMTGTNFSSWFTSDGTFYFEFDNSRRVVTSANPTPVALGQYVAGDLIAILINNGNVGSGATMTVWGSGGTGLQQQTITSGSTVATGNKAAFAFSVSGKTCMGALRNGISAAATTTGTVNAKTILFIGGNGSGTSLVRDWLDAPIQRIKFFPYQMTSAQLQALTA